MEAELNEVVNGVINGVINDALNDPSARQFILTDSIALALIAFQWQLST